MTALLKDVEFKVGQLKYEALPAPLTDDELFAVVAYTYHIRPRTQSNYQGHPNAGQLFYELNSALRQSTREGHTAALRPWSGYLFYLLRALEKVPDEDTVVFRGTSDFPEEKYTEGANIQWGAFASCSRAFDTAKGFVPNRQQGVVFQLKLQRGKSLQPYSYFAMEDEVLITAQTRFVVTSEPKLKRGVRVVKMIETKPQDEVYIS